MQVLYQFDMQGGPDLAAVRMGLEDGHVSIPVAEQALALAQAAWESKSIADAAATRLAPHWPTSRQPPVDRAILRLGYYEIASGYAPGPVAVDEAVEMAKQYCAEQSPAFINAILDRILKSPPTKVSLPEVKVKLRLDPDAVAKADSSDPWLNDALETEEEYDGPDDHDHMAP